MITRVSNKSHSLAIEIKPKTIQNNILKFRGCRVNKSKGKTYISIYLQVFSVIITDRCIFFFFSTQKIYSCNKKI